MLHVQKHLDICSGHVTMEDMDTLAMYSQAHDHIINCIEYHYGAIIFVPFLHEPQEDQDAFLEEVRAAGYSSALCDVFRMAYREEAEMIKLDCDGVQVMGLKTFDW